MDVGFLRPILTALGGGNLNARLLLLVLAPGENEDGDGK